MIEPTRWADAPIDFYVAIHCKRCGAMKPIIVRTLAGGDGSCARRCVCRRCSARFVAVIEPPEIGSDGDDNL